MHICRFTLNADEGAGPRVGLLDDDGIRDVTAATEALPTLRWPLPPGDQFVANLDTLRPRMAALAKDAPVIARADVKLLSPVANPGKMICGLGNWNNVMKFGQMGFLFKVTSALAGEAEGVQLRWPDRVTLHEPELAIVIGRKCTNVPAADALDYVAGYTVGLDTTLKKDTEDFSFCKSFDTYATLGPALVTADEIADPAALTYRFWVNDEPRGERNFSDLTGGVPQLIEFASSAMTLYPGDVIFSGAVDVAPIVAGDVMRLEIPRVGRIDVAVAVSPDARSGAPA